MDIEKTRKERIKKAEARCAKIDKSIDRFHGKHFGDYFDCLGIPWEEVV